MASSRALGALHVICLSHQDSLPRRAPILCWKRTSEVRPLRTPAFPLGPELGLLSSLAMASPVSVSRVDVHLRTLRRSRGRTCHFSERGARHGLESSSILLGRTVAPSSSFCTRRRGQYSPAEPSSSRRLCPSSRYHILPSPEPQAQPLRPGIQPNPTPRPPPPVHEKEKRRYVSLDMSSGCLPCQDVGAVYMCAASGIYIFIQENASRHGG